jgi:hypothetical protein
MPIWGPDRTPIDTLRHSRRRDPRRAFESAGAEFIDENGGEK